MNFQLSEAIKAGIATAINPTAAVAVSNDVLTAYYKF